MYSEIALKYEVKQSKNGKILPNIPGKLAQ